MRLGAFTVNVEVEGQPLKDTRSKSRGTRSTCCVASKAEKVSWNRFSLVSLLFLPRLGLEFLQEVLTKPNLTVSGFTPEQAFLLSCDHEPGGSGGLDLTLFLDIDRALELRSSVVVASLALFFSLPIPAISLFLLLYFRILNSVSPPSFSNPSFLLLLSRDLRERPLLCVSLLSSSTQGSSPSRSSPEVHPHPLYSALPKPLKPSTCPRSPRRGRPCPSCLAPARSSCPCGFRFEYRLRYGEFPSVCKERSVR